MGRVLHAPAVHFLALGALLLVAREWWAPPEGAGTGMAVGDDEVLHRAALALGIDRADAATRTRLARLGEFVGEADAGDEAALVTEARRLGLERSDLVIRRHLIQMMRIAIGRPTPADRPTEEALAAYLDAHAGEFRTPERVRLTHVYLSADRHGARLERDAADLLATLRRHGIAPAAAAATQGDPFVHGSTIGPLAVGDVARRFGGGFARALAAAPVGAWSGPMRSTYGLHLVWVDERLPATVPPLAAVRSQVTHRWLEERGAARAEERLAALRTRFAH